MPTRSPQVGSQFNLTTRTRTGAIHLNGREQDISDLGLWSEQLQNDLLVEMRNAGVWFTDIASIFGLPSASAASWTYIRLCRARGIQPRVRQARQSNTEAGIDELPEYLSRVGFQGETDFSFGVELETERLGCRQASTIVDQLGYPCAFDGYTHGNTHRWKVVTDGSLNGGAEVVSRVLRGTDGLAEMRRVQMALKAGGAKISVRCGMHIHIGVEHLSPRERAVVIRMYAAFQGVFDLFVKERRRSGQYSQHRSMRNALSYAQSWENESNTTDTRYKSLNLCSYEKYGTFEFRTYQGCLNPQQATAWIQLHMDFIHWCCQLARESQNRVYETDFKALVSVTMPLTEEQVNSTDVKVGTRTAQAINANGDREDWKLNSHRVLEEWCAQGGIISNPRIAQILKDQAKKFCPLTEGA